MTYTQTQTKRKSSNELEPKTKYVCQLTDFIFKNIPIPGCNIFVRAPT